MSTEFYLADPRYMSKEEIEIAEACHDPDSLLCHQTGGGNGSLHFNLRVGNVLFYNLPKDVRLANDSGSSIETVGELIALTKEKKNKIIPVHQVRKEVEEGEFPGSLSDVRRKYIQKNGKLLPEESLAA